MKKLKFLFEKSFLKATLRLALPIALQNLLVTSFAIVDNIMVGNISENAISAVGMSGQIAFYMNVILFGICSGGAVFAAQFWGSRNIRGIRRTYGIVLISCLMVGTLFFCLAQTVPAFLVGIFTTNNDIIEIGVSYIKIASFSYFGVALNLAFSAILRSTEVVAVSMVASGVSVFTNIFFNWVFIFGKLGFPELGVCGAALATVISATVNPIIIFAISYFKKNILISPIKQIFAFSGGAFSAFFKIAAPVIFNELMWSSGVIAYNAVFGHMPPDGNFTALTIARNIEDIVFVLFIGICNACAVIVGKQIGENKIDKVKEYSRRYIILFPILGVVLGAVLIMVRMPILSLYKLSDYVRATASALIIIFSIESPMRNLPYICIVGIFRAGGDTKTGMKYDVLSLWLVGLPLTTICGLVFKLDFLLVYTIMLLGEDIIKTVLSLKHYYSYKWIRPIESNPDSL